MPVSNLSDLVKIPAQYANFQVRFPETPEKVKLEKQVGDVCKKRLKAFTIENSNDLSQYGEAWAVCRSLIQDDNLREQLSAKHQTASKDIAKIKGEKEIKSALGETDFLIKWDKALRQVKWGRRKTNFYVRKDIRRLWDEGKENENCKCKLEDEEVCHVYHGEKVATYEVVVRFFEKSLYQLDLCGLYTTDGGHTIMQFLGKISKLKSKRREIQAFLSDRGGILEQSAGVKYSDSMRGNEILLRKEGGFFKVAYISRAENIRKNKREAQIERKAEAAEERARRERIKRGFKVGDCVMWECSPVCNFYGTVRRVKGGKLRIGVETCGDDPAKVGRAVWLVPADVFDCD